MKSLGNNMTSTFLLFLHIFCRNATQACQQNMVSIFKCEMFISRHFITFWIQISNSSNFIYSGMLSRKTTSPIFFGVHFSCYSPEPFNYYTGKKTSQLPDCSDTNILAHSCTFFKEKSEQFFKMATMSSPTTPHLHSFPSNC